jgi:hypothetical protein
MDFLLVLLDFPCLGICPPYLWPPRNAARSKFM